MRPCGWSEEVGTAGRDAVYGVVARWVGAWNDWGSEEIRQRYATSVVGVLVDVQAARSRAKGSGVSK